MQRTITTLRGFGLVVLALAMLMFTTTQTQAASPKGQGTVLNAPVDKSPVFSEDFENEEFPPVGWTMHSEVDGAPNWTRTTSYSLMPGEGSAFHGASNESMLADWLISPQIDMSEAGFNFLSFYSHIVNTWQYEKNSVLISTGSPDPADGDFVEVWVQDQGSVLAYTWVKNYVDLEEYMGEQIYIAFRYQGVQWGHEWRVDNVSIVDNSPILDIPEESQSVNGAVSINGTISKKIEIGNDGLSELTFTTAINYESGSDWLTINPDNGSIVGQASIEISFVFDAAGLDVGDYEATVTLTTNDTENPTATIDVALQVVNTNVYPFTEDFEGEMALPIGWTTYSLELSEPNWVIEYMSHGDGMYSAYHSYSWEGPADNWLVMPLISIPTDGFFYLSFWSFLIDAPYYEQSSVWVSTGSPDPADGDYLELWSLSDLTESMWKQVVVNLESYAGQDVYIAFRYEGDYAHMWFVDDISLGEEMDDDPLLGLSVTNVTSTLGQDGSISKSFVLRNDGIKDLTFEMEVEYGEGAENWLTVAPPSGSVGAYSSVEINLDFDATGLDMGEYVAQIIIETNDSEHPEASVTVTLTVMEAIPVEFEVIYSEHTYPTGISSDGMHVVGTLFGGDASYMWTKFQGQVFIPDAVQGVSDLGQPVGSFKSEFTYNDMQVEVAGIWDSEKLQWEFLGMHPDVPNFFDAFYSTAYGISADGTTVVGMQWYEGWNVKAFKWTREDGFTMLSPSISFNTRANGISADGSVIYGWAEPVGSRTPVVWHNGETIFVDQNAFGEAFGASAQGTYVTGSLGADGFIWSADKGTVVFENTLNMGGISPTTVLEDGTVFGYTNDGFPPIPPFRRAFARHPDGVLVTFNEYAQERGWFGLDDWVFYSINDVTPDATKFIGAAQMPEGNDVSFVLDLAPGTPTIEVYPLEISQQLEPDESASQIATISNVSDGMLKYDANIQYTDSDSKVRPVPQGTIHQNANLKLDRTITKGGIPAGSRSQTLNYDGENGNAIGLTGGGMFYGAVRFPSNLTAAYAGYTLGSVDVFIGDLPDALTMYVWDAGTTTSPGSVLLEMDITPSAQSWINVALETPVDIEGTDLWIGFKVEHSAGLYPLGTDLGPAHADGGWLSEDAIDWMHLEDVGLSVNWNIRANISFGGMEWLTLTNTSGIITGDESAEMDVQFDALGLPLGTYTANIRITSNDTENPLIIVPVTLEVGTTSVQEVSQDVVGAYPNPASNRISISSVENISSVKVMNLLGQTVLTVPVTGNETHIDVSVLPEGTYLLEVRTTAGLSVKKVQVKR